MFTIIHAIRKNIPIFLLFIFPILIFHQHVFREAIWIGNPDRLNNFLKLLKYYVENQIQGHTNAWNDYELMGYDSYGLPFIFPSILSFFTGYINKLIDISLLYVTAGYISIFLLSLCGISAYFFIQTFTHDKAISLVSASCYQLSALTVLNMSQSDNTLLILTTAPLIVIGIRNFQTKKISIYFTGFTVLLFLMINFLFLQTVSYVLLLSISYILYRSIKKRNKYLPIAFFSAIIIAVLANIPRLITIFYEFQEYTRQLPPRLGIDVNNFEEIYKVHTHFIEIFRWFDNAILGRTPYESIKINGINISEGFLLYSTSFIPFLIIYSTIYYKGKFFQLATDRKLDAAFFFWTLIITLCIIFIKPLLYLFYLLYFKISFFHSRALIVGLLSVSILSAYSLLDLHERYVRGLVQNRKKIHIFSSLIFAFSIVFIIEIMANQKSGFLAINHVNIVKESFTRTFLSGIFFVALIYLISSTKITRPELKFFSYYSLCFSIIIQAFISSYSEVNNKENFTMGNNFSTGGFYYAKPDQFLLPDENSKASLNNLLENDQYRTLLICNPHTVDPLCVGHIPGFWGLRVANGYYGFGLPKRLTLLSWEYSLRSITFLDINDLPWDLLSLLTVKYAVEATPELYQNMPFDKKNISIKINPYPVLPRAFFAESIKPVHNSKSARDHIFKNPGIQDVRKISAVEGNLLAKTYPTQGDISVTGGGDRLIITVTPSEQERFLVLNDLYFPGWSAKTNGQELPVYPTNIFARGIVVPPLANTIVFEYKTLSNSPNTWFFYLGGFLVLIIGATLFKKFSK